MHAAQGGSGLRRGEAGAGARPPRRDVAKARRRRGATGRRGWVGQARAQVRDGEGEGVSQRGSALAGQHVRAGALVCARRGGDTAWCGCGCGTAEPHAGVVKAGPCGRRGCVRVSSTTTMRPWRGKTVATGLRVEWDKLWPFGQDGEQRWAPAGQQGRAAYGGLRRLIGDERRPDSKEGSRALGGGSLPEGLGTTSLAPWRVDAGESGVVL